MPKVKYGYTIHTDRDPRPGTLTAEDKGIHVSMGGCFEAEYVGRLSGPATFGLLRVLARMYGYRLQKVGPKKTGRN